MAKNKASGFIKNKNGTWSIDTKVKINGTFKHFTKSGYKTLSSAKSDLERAKNEFISNNTNRKNTIFFEDLVEEYEKKRRIIVDQSTIECDYGTFRNYMYPYFKGKMIKDVFNETVIYDWFHSLVENPKYSNNKKSKVITRMKDLLKFAYNHKHIDANTYQDCDVQIYQVKYSKKPKNERVVWSNDEEQRFLKAIKKNKKVSLMFRIFLVTSPRLGEFLALQPSSFDFKKNKIKISQQVKNVSGKGVILTDKLKTNDSYRNIIIPKDISIELKQYIDDFDIKDDEYLWFRNDKSIPMSRNTIRRLFDRYCDIAGVRRMNLHALRHNQAVKLASVCKTGIDIEIAAKRLGHTPSMFMNTYANHANEDKEVEILERMYSA